MVRSEVGFYRIIDYIESSFNGRPDRIIYAAGPSLHYCFGRQFVNLPRCYRLPVNGQPFSYFLTLVTGWDLRRNCKLKIGLGLFGRRCLKGGKVGLGRGEYNVDEFYILQVFF